MRPSILLGALALASCTEGMTLTSAAPDTVSARGGATVTLHGSGFASDATVTLDGNAIPSKLVSASEIEITMPPLWAGKVSIAVASGGLSANLDDAIAITALDLGFVQAPPYAFAQTSDAPLRVAIARDVDGDGAIDLVTCGAGESCRVLLNDGRGNFLAAEAVPARFPPSKLDPRAIAAADFDGDGDVDLFLGVATAGPGVIETNDGHGVFTESAISSTKATKVDAVTTALAADVDGDGKIDLVLGSTVADSPPLRILRNRSSSDLIRF
ncbi:hypothetical protein BH09MYX1_BH09MYX1_66270 [soil metagenome]